MNRSLRVAVTCLMLAVVAAAAPSPAAAGDVDITVEGLAWLAGDWRGTISEGDLSQEIWSGPAGGELMGMWRWVSGGRVRLYEFFTIAGDGVPVMRLRHFSRELVPWESERDTPLILRVVAHGDREVSFEGAENGKTVRLTYRRPTGDELHAILEEDGGRTTFRYRLQR